MRADEDLYTLEELEELPMLKKIHWNKRKLAALIAMGLLNGYHDTGEGKYLVTLRDIKMVLAFRNESLKTRMVNPDDLNK